MFVLFFFLYFSPDLCNSQMVYSRVMPYDPRYIIHRSPPVRRSAMEALERLRLPVTRYFPQVDTQAASAPYQAPIAPLTGYQLTSEDIYALPPQWTDDFVQQLPERNEDEADYGNYEYEGSLNPVYRAAYPSDVYAQEPMEPEAGDGNLYNDLMVNYLMGDSDPKEVMDQSEIFDMQRRSGGNNAQQSNAGVINISNVQEANKNASNSASNNSTLAPPVPFPSQPSPQVQVTAVPSAPEKKEMKSLVIPEPTLGERSDLSEEWREEGQKEEPLFRPLQNSQRTTWSELEGPLARAKNTPKK
ncbi:uncharacterized protein LOC118182970, partial [Stegodyphus dumicola]|uniref:uncharacterized protein LOC118182970 n=1 Tax=Stegodyphus dumicola TaxID=202533 RepID=UPI0015ADB00A